MICGQELHWTLTAMGYVLVYGGVFALGLCVGCVIRDEQAERQRQRDISHGWPPLPEPLPPPPPIPPRRK